MKNIKCPKCGSEKIWKAGKRNGTESNNINVRNAEENSEQNIITIKNSKEKQ